jgi:antitoxin CcdA
VRIVRIQSWGILVHHLYNDKASKKSANLRVNSDLLVQAKFYGINLSLTLELAPIEAISEHRMRLWQEDNREAIDSYNEHVEKKGVFGDGLRGF